MTTPIEQLSFKPAGATTAKTLENYAAEKINVRDYGATGNGSTDDVDCIQAALNAAFGMSMFQGAIASGTSTTAILTVSGAATGRPLSFAPIVAGMTMSFPTVQLDPLVTGRPITMMIAAFGTGGTTGTGGVGTYSLSFAALSSGTLASVGAQPMMACIGQGSYARKKVFIPGGNYHVSHPLYILGVLGAYVYGAGNGSTQLYYTGNASEGNILINAGFSGNNTWTPLIAMDGVAYGKLEMFDVNSLVANNETANFVGIVGYQSGPVGTTSSMILENMNVSNFWTGVAGVQGAGNVENFILTNVTFQTCGMNGVLLTGQNVLNWQIYGGGASGCGWLSTYVLSSGAGTPGAAYNAGVGSIGCLYGLSCTGNKIDIYNQGQQMHVAGGSFEGPTNYNGTLTWVGGTATMTTNNPHKLQGATAAIIIYGATIHTGYNGRYTGTITGPTTVTYSISSPGGSDSGTLVSGDATCIACNGTNISIDAIAYRIGNSAYLNPFYNAGGMVFATGCSINTSNNGDPGYIVYLSNGITEMHGTLFSACQSSSFKGIGASELYLRGSIYIGTPTTPFAQFTGGRVRDYDQIYEATVAALPTAAAIFTGLRGFVTDASAATFGTTVAPGGSNHVPVFCDGTNWKIG